MQTLTAEVCSNCGSALEETAESELGCMLCLLRVGLTAEDNDPDELVTPNDRFGIYLIEHHEDGTLHELGRGATGVTYCAIDQTLQRKVALKIINLQLATRSAEARERFARGARAAATLRHENIATVYQFGILEETGQCFYAMELVEGETLESRVYRTGPLNVRTVINIARQVAEALAAAEKRGLVHRDLKPANLMLIETEEVETERSAARRTSQRDVATVKVIDFGLAKAIQTGIDPMSLTKGGFVGTPAFASPEQFDGARTDVRSDIYSLGATLWFALTGKKLFSGGSVEEIRSAQQAQALPVEQLRAARVPSRLISLLKSMLSVEPAARPSTHDLIALLRRSYPQATGLKTSTRMALVAAMVVIVGAAGLFSVRLLHLQHSTPSVAVPEKSIAVLPFEILSGDANNAYLADGLQEEILTRLSQIADLKVISRSSTQRFKGASRNLRQIGNQLGVANLLEGSVQKAGDEVRVHVQLIKAESDSHVWAEKYDRKLTDIFSVETDVASKIADKLEANLTGQERRAVTARPTEDSEAHEMYMRGRYSVEHRRAAADIKKGIDYYNKALALDPKYALAYAGLAEAYFRLPFWEKNPNDDDAKAKQAAQKALELDDQISEAHVALAETLYANFDIAGAKNELERAIALDPNYVTAHYQYGVSVLTATGDADRALAELNTAFALDPLSPMTGAQLGIAYINARRYPEAQAQLQKVIRLEPTFPYGYMALGGAYAASGHVDQAIALWNQAYSLSKDYRSLALVGYGYALKGERERTLQVLGQLQEMDKNGPPTFSFAQGMIHMALGEKERALDYFEESFRRRESPIDWIRVDPVLDPLRGNPRFEKLANQIVPEELMASNSTQKSIAVLPFQNLSPQPDRAYFAAGIRSQIVGRLMKISNLQVISDSRKTPNGGAPASIQQIAHDLGVKNVLQGSVEQAGDKFRISVRLVDADKNIEVWTQAYEPNFADMPHLENEVAREVASTLGLKLTVTQRRVMTAVATSNPQAYDAYLKGRYVWLQRSNDSYHYSVEYFNKAIALDPKYAQAYAGLADAYQFLGTSYLRDRKENYRQAKIACQKALELNPELAEAHASAGLIAMNYDWDWGRAGDEFERAVALDPNNALIYDWYAEYLAATGRQDESLTQMSYARELDPFSLLIQSDMGKLLYYARAYDRAETQLKETLQMDPECLWAHFWLGSLYTVQRRFDEAIAEFTEYGRRERMGLGVWRSALLAYVYGAAGNKSEAERLLKLMKKEEAFLEPSDGLVFAFACIGVGDKDGAFAGLEKDYQMHATTMTSLKINPWYDSLRSDPRFTELMRKVHLAP